LLFLYKESIRQENQLSSSAIDFVSFQTNSEQNERDA